MDENASYSRLGYLNEDFRLFHLSDSFSREFEYHYHDFDKVVILISGKVNYIIEGVSYCLEPWDVLLVGHHLIHKPVIDSSEKYERVIIYINAGFVEAGSTVGAGLMNCFRIAEKKGFYLVRPSKEEQAEMQKLLHGIEEASVSKEFAADIMAKALFLQLLVRINREILRDDTGSLKASCVYDKKITLILTYINEHLADCLTVEDLASRCYISRYHFMRRFKETTGYTVHSYISQKRLLYAAGLIRQGTQATRAATMSGFSDYSTFLRSFKRMFGVTPGGFS